MISVSIRDIFFPGWIALPHRQIWPPRVLGDVKVPAGLPFDAPACMHGDDTGCVAGAVIRSGTLPSLPALALFFPGRVHRGERATQLQHDERYSRPGFSWEAGVPSQPHCNSNEHAALLHGDVPAHQDARQQLLRTAVGQSRRQNSQNLVFAGRSPRLPRSTPFCRLIQTHRYARGNQLASPDSQTSCCAW
jgi:hypothetical protein